MKIEVYSKNNCPYCNMAKMFFKKHKVEYTEILMDDQAERQAFYDRIGDNVKSVPQIFVDDVRIGGYSEMIASQFAKDIENQTKAGNFEAEF